MKRHRFTDAMLLPLALLASAGNCAFAQDGRAGIQPFTERRQQLLASWRGSRRAALLVGTGNCDHLAPTLTSRTYAISDITELQQVLMGQGYRVTRLVDREATSGNILANLHEMGRTFQNGEGTSLFVFAGCGYMTDLDSYLVTYKSDPRQPADPGLSLQDLKDTMMDAPARYRVALIDAGRVAWPDRLPGKRLADRSDVRVLYATRPGDDAGEDSAMQHSLFMKPLLEVLRGHAAGRDRSVTFADVSQYTVTSMESYGAATGRLQSPRVLGESTGDLVLAHLTAEPAASAAPRGRQAQQRWRSTLDNGLYLVDLDPAYLTIRRLDRRIVADMHFQANATRYSYKGTTQMGPASGCERGWGEIRLRSAGPARLELEIEIPNPSSRGLQCGGIPIPGLKNWERFSLILEAAAEF